MSGLNSNQEPLDLESPVVAFMRQGTAYPDPTSRVEVIETHISWLFLTDRFVYKLKKPVKFEFLDFSDKELRRAACLQELHLNRRLAPDVYLDVVPITMDSRGRMRLGGEGRPIDWVVRMKRLSANRSLAQLIEQQQLKPEEVHWLAQSLARFYARLPPKTVNAEAYLHGIEHHVRANFDELMKSDYGLDPWLVRRLQAAQLRFIAIARETIIDRVRDGRIVDGHGDLRPEHIYLNSTPKVIDCVEFSEELRTVDVVDELAFLAMECDRLNADWVGRRILDTYCDTNVDRAPGELVEFFKSYRACVRAKVNALSSRQIPALAVSRLDTATGYLRLADRSAARLGPPCVLVVRGLSGTGKSTVASVLSESLGCEWLSTDNLRRRLFANRNPADGYDDGHYSLENRSQVYDELFRQAAAQVEQGLTLVLDGTFLNRENCRRAVELAQANRAIPLFVTCTCPADLARARIRERQFSDPFSASDASPEFVARQQAELEQLEPEWPNCPVDTTDGLSSIRQQVFDRLRSIVLPRCADTHESESECDCLASAKTSSTFR